MIGYELEKGRECSGVRAILGWKRLLFGHIPLVFFVCVSFIGFSLAAIPLAEREALIAIYWATDGKNWKHNRKTWSSNIGYTTCVY
jgi:hypothetical protein